MSDATIAGENTARTSRHDTYEQRTETPDARVYDLEDHRWQKLAELDAEREVEVVRGLLVMVDRHELSALRFMQIVRAEP